MAACILQLNFKLNVTADEYRAAVEPLAQAFAEVPGLVWKIWMLDADAGEAGGIYLFRDEAARQAFLDGDLAAKVKAAPFLRDLSARPFAVMAEVTETTRGPVREPVPA